MERDEEDSDPIHGESLLSPTQTADYLGISYSTLARMRLNQSGPAFLKIGTGRAAPVRYRLCDLLSWLDEHRVRSTSEHAVRRKEGNR